MAMWLLQIAISPADAAAAQSRLGDRVAEISAALVASGAPADAKITLAAPDATIALESGAPLAIDSVSYNPASGRFLVRARDDKGTPLAITGSAIASVMLPVPARPIARGKIVEEADIDWIETASAGGNVYLADADAVIGKAARRPLAAGAPLRASDLQSPVLIKRGATAVIVVEAPGLRLTQAAVALANGAAGDIIAFRNVNSDREFKAVVTAKDRARAPFRGTLAALEL